MEVISQSFVRLAGDSSGDVYYVFFKDSDNGSLRLVNSSDLAYLDDMDDSVSSLSVPADNGSDDKPSVIPLEPVDVTEETVRRFWRMDVTAWELAEKGLFPFSDEFKRYPPTEDDIFGLIENAGRRKSFVALSLWCACYCEMNNSLFFLQFFDQNFSLITFIDSIVQAVGCFEPDIDDWTFLEDLKASYLTYRDNPLTLMKTEDPLFSRMMELFYARAHFSSSAHAEAPLYASRLEDALRSDNPALWRLYAYAYYGGNDFVPCDWKKSEKALLKLYGLRHNPRYRKDMCYEAANSLGYIYYSHRVGNPDYAKAFKYFSYAAEHGMIEATYKLFDMLSKGHGVAKDYGRAWQLISRLHSIIGEDELKYPDVALRMGYCYRDGIGVEVDRETALEYFVRAQNSLRHRLKNEPQFGDEVVMKNIKAAIDSLKDGNLHNGKTC